MTGVKYDGTVKFSKLMEQLSEITDKEGKPSRHLRLTKAGEQLRLYTHDPNKWHGLNFIKRWKKHARAYRFVKDALVKEFGRERARQVLLAVELPRNKAITVADMGRINAALVKDQERLVKLLPAGMSFVRHEGGLIVSAYSKFSFSAEENKCIGDGLIDLLRTGRSERSKRSDSLVDPQFVKDSHRMSRRFTRGRESFELRDLMLPRAEAERQGVAYELLAGVVTRPEDDQELVRRKVGDLTRLLTQSALSDTSKMLADKRDGVTGAKDGTEKTSFEYDEVTIDGELWLYIGICSEERLVRFSNHGKNADVALREDASFQRIDQKILVKEADIGQSLRDDSLKIVYTTVETRMVLDPTQSQC